MRHTLPAAACLLLTGCVAYDPYPPPPIMLYRPPPVEMPYVPPPMPAPLPPPEPVMTEPFDPDPVLLRPMPPSSDTLETPAPSPQPASPAVAAPPVVVPQEDGGAAVPMMGFRPMRGQRPAP